eukprot:COSAG04_NODE_3543_length_2722_cov_75.937095_3_plen_75_part_00
MRTRPPAPLSLTVVHHRICHSDHAAPAAVVRLGRDLVPRVTGPLEGVKLGFTETRPAYLQWNVSLASSAIIWGR